MNSNGQSEPTPNGDEDRSWMSDYLDDRLSPQRRSDIERQLAADPALRGELEAMAATGREVREWFAAQTPPTLGDGFADAVVDAAIDRARQEGLDDSHPLIVAGAAPATVPFRPAQHRWQRTRGWKRWGAAAAVVAAVAFGVVMLPGGDGADSVTSGTGDAVLAQADPKDSPPENTEATPLENVIKPQSDSVAIARENNPSAKTPLDAPEQLAMSDADAAPGVPDTSTGNAVSSAGAASSARGPSQPPTRDVAKTNADKRDVRVATAQSPVVRKDQTKAKDLVGTAFLVFEFNLVDGIPRETVINDAMTALQVEMNSSGEDSDAKAAVDAAPKALDLDPESPFQMMYVMAPSSLIDHAYLSLRSRQDQVASVRIAFVDDAKMATEINRMIAVDGDFSRATGKDAAARTLFIPKGGPRASIREAIDKAVFIDGLASGVALTASGVDTRSQVVFLFR